jgi:hypothetical protein
MIARWAAVDSAQAAGARRRPRRSPQAVRMIARWAAVDSAQAAGARKAARQCS